MQRFKQLLTEIGHRMPGRVVTGIRSTANYLAVGHWMRSRGFGLPPRVALRSDVWRSMAGPIADQRVLYLEFGVYQGDSIRFWCQLLRNEHSHLEGFDSFEGLPEAGGPWQEGQFDVAGQMPRIDDHRVRFHKGWFDDTLKDYSPPAHDVLVVNLDADLYSSTRTVLTALRPWIRPGTLLYFDEFNHLDHEPRAFGEFLATSGLRFEACCADRTLNFIAFRCIGTG